MWRARRGVDHELDMVRTTLRAIQRGVPGLTVLAVAALAAIALSGWGFGRPQSAGPNGRPGASDAAKSVGVAPSFSVRELMTVLTRSGVGPGQVTIDLTYAPPIFFEITGLQPPAEMSSRPTLAFMLQETIHEGPLSVEPPTVFMVLAAGRVPPYDVKVTASDPHHRTTRLLFPDPFGSSASSGVSGDPHAVKLVVPLADGTVSGGNTFEWRLPSALETTATDTSPGTSR